MKRTLTLLTGLVYGVLVAVPAAANPTGPSVAHGAATFAQPDAATLQITNTPNTVINWQGFSIGASETTQFIQSSAASAVLNRVVGVDPSQILGSLRSNGQVFLINPNGLVFGAGAVVDTAGFIGSTLGMRDADFLAGQLRFEGPDAGSIENHGVIKARGDGGVYLVAPQIENDGIVRTEDGRVLLAAGRKLTISSLDVDHISFEIQAPDDSVVNLGELLTGGGAAGVFAGHIVNAGRIRADTMGRDAAGRIVLRSSGETLLASGSELVASAPAGQGGAIAVTGASVRIEAARLDASGARGGTVRVAATHGDVRNAGHIDASGQHGGQVTLRASGDVEHRGSIAAGASTGDAGSVLLRSGGTTALAGTSSTSAMSGAGRGGRVELLGPQVGLFDRARVNAGGATAGGTVLVGGDTRGTGSVPVARAVYVAPETQVRADATAAGDGGKVVIFGSEVAKVHGALSARGGPTGGNGGFIETSGLDSFQISRTPDVRAPAGNGGRWLIDPHDISIVAGAGNTNINALSPFVATGDSAQLGVDLVTGALSGGASVVVDTGGTGAQQGDISLIATLDYDTTGFGSLTLNAAGGITIAADIIDGAAGGDALNLTLNADTDSNGSGDVTVLGDLELAAGSLDVTAVNVTIGALAQTTALDVSAGQVDVDADTMDVFSGAVANAATTIVSVGGINIDVLSGDLRFIAGAGASSPITVQAAGSGVFDVAGDLNLSAGTGANGFVDVELGPGTDFLIGNDLFLGGGPGAGADVFLAADSFARLSVGNAGFVLGGAGNAAGAVLRSDSSGLTATFGDTLVVRGGSGTDSAAAISAAAGVDITTVNNLLVEAGTAPDTSAFIEAGTDSAGLLRLAIGGFVNLSANFGSTNTDADAAIENLLGDVDIDIGSTLTVTGGDSANTFAFIESAGAMTLDVVGAATLTGGTAGGNAADVGVQAQTGMTATFGGPLTIAGGAGPSNFVDLGTVSGTASIVTSGDVNVTGGAALSTGAVIFGDTVAMDVGGNLTVAAGSGDFGFAAIDTPNAVIDVSGNVSVLAGPGNAAEAWIGAIATPSTVTLGASAPIGGTISLTSGPGTPGAAFLGTGCMSPPCAAVVNVDTTGGLTMTGGSEPSFIGSRTALAGDGSGSVSIDSAGPLAFADNAVFTPGAITLSAPSVAQSAAATTGGLHGASLNIVGSTGISLESNVNDVGSFTASLLGGRASFDFHNDATLDAANGLGLTLGALTTADATIDVFNTGMTSVAGTVTAAGAGADVIIAASSPLFVNAPITASNDVILTAGASAAPGDDVVLNQPVTAISGDITVSAEDNVFIQQPLTAAGTITAVAALGSVEGPGLLTAPTVDLDASGGSVGGLGAMFTDTPSLSISGASVTVNVFNAGGGVTVPGLSLSGNLFISADGPINQAGALTVAGASGFNAFDNPITLTDGSNQFMGGLAVSNFGANAVSVSGTGPLSLNGGLLGNAFTASGFSSVANNGLLALPDGAVINVGGTLINNGVIAPGNSPGTVTIVGNLTLTPSSVLEIELAPDEISDVLIVTGTAALDGTLEIKSFDGFAGDPDIDFEIIQCGTCVGDFAVVRSVPPVFAIERFPGLTSYFVNARAGEDFIDPIDDVVGIEDLLDDLDELGDLEEELEDLEEDLEDTELALEDDADASEDDEDEPQGLLICL